MELPLRCIICDKQPEPAFKEDPGVVDINWQPFAATAFIANGHYGSTVWDPVTGCRQLWVNICDDCLRARSGAVAVYIPPRPQPLESGSLVPWDPDEEMQ